MVCWQQLVLILDIVYDLIYKYVISFEICRAENHNKDITPLHLMIQCMLDMYAPVASVIEMVIMNILNSYLTLFSLNTPSKYLL